MFGRNLRKNLPKGAKNKTLEEFKQKDRNLKEYQRGNTDKRRWAKNRASLTRGDQVWVKTSEEKEGSRGAVEEKAKEQESYYVRIVNKTSRGNRKHLRKLKEEPENSKGQSTCKKDLEEGGYENNETSSEECRQGNRQVVGIVAIIMKKRLRVTDTSVRILYIIR